LEKSEGPLPEKDGMMGAGLKSRVETVGRIVATGLLQLNYAHRIRLACEF